MSEPVLKLHPEAIEGIASTLMALEQEAKELRAKLRDSEGQRLFLEGALQNMSRHIVALHAQFDERLTMLTLKHEARCQEIERKVAEVGACADRSAQLLTVTVERMNGLASREEV